MNYSIPAPASFIMEFIGSLEAPKGYNTVYNNQMKRMPKPLTSMTFDEVVADGPRRTREFGSSACGRFQFMRDTLDAKNTNADLKGELNLTGNEKFDKKLQDYMCFHLLKRRGYDKFITGKMSVNTFGNNLAKEWASFPVLSSINGKRRGQSYYAGDGKNHSLTSADKMEAVLRQALSMAGNSKAPSEPIQAIPVLPATPPATGGVGGFLASMWAKFGTKPAAVSLPTRGDPTIWNIQTLLKARNYMANGKIDGIDGPRTRDAVSASRKDNGMSDGGIDDEFIKRLPSFPTRPVSEERAKATTSEAYAIAKEQAPDLTKNVSTLWQGGLASLIFGGGGVAQVSGVLDQVKETGDKANDVLGSVQSAFAGIATVIQFIYNYWPMFAIGFGIFLLFKAANAALAFVIRVKTAFGM